MKNKWIWHFQQLTAGEQIFTAKLVSKSKLRWSSLWWGHGEGGDVSKIFKI